MGRVCSCRRIFDCGVILYRLLMYFIFEGMKLKEKENYHFILTFGFEGLGIIG